MGLPALLSLLLGALAPPLLSGSALPPNSRPADLLREADDGASGGQSSSTSAPSSGGRGDSTPSPPSGGRGGSAYLRLLLTLDAVASHEVDAALATGTTTAGQRRCNVRRRSDHNCEAVSAA